MKRMIGVVLATLIASIALSATTVVGAEGRGHAVNAAGKRAEFHMGAWKSRNAAGEVHVGGFCKFIAFEGTNTNPESHGITLPAVQKLAKVGNVCEYSGPAKMVIRHGNNFETVHGVCFVRVQDRHTPLHGGEPDLIKIRFVAANTGHVYEWAGKVVKGDIVVFERHVD